MRSSDLDRNHRPMCSGWADRDSGKSYRMDLPTRPRPASAGVMRQLQTGYLYHYAFAMIIGLTMLLGWLLWIS